jgi:cobalt/nickel transport system permease protein
MSSFFIDSFALRDNSLSRIDARVKLLLSMNVIICLLLSRHVTFPLAVLACCLVAAMAIEATPRLIIMRLAAPMGMIFVLVLLQSFLRGTTPLWALNVGALKLTMTKEGVQAGALCGMHVFSAVSVVFLLSLVTPVHRIFHALRWMRIPHEWVEIATLMYRYLFTLHALASDITAAQKLRLGYKGGNKGMKSMAVMIGTVIIRSIDQAMRTHDAMMLRGYQGSISFGAIPPLVRSDCMLLIISGLITTGLYFILEWGLH